MQLKIEKAKFSEFSLEEIFKALQEGLSKNYKEVKVSVTDCPNLRNWNCPAEGINGNQKIIDVGGEPYMHDPKFLGTEFDYEEISKKIFLTSSFKVNFFICTNSSYNK